MKTTLGILLVLFIFTLPSWAGVGSTGGGGAVVCRDETGVIQSAELLDLYEAKSRYGLTLLESTGSLEGDYVEGVKNTYRLQGAGSIVIGAETRKNLDNFSHKLEFVSQDLTVLGDIGDHPALPSGCAIEQLAIFYDASDGVSVMPEDRIQVSKEIWQALDVQSRAALVTHELFYKYERALAEKTSESTRSAVAHIYSGNPEPVKSGLPENAKQYASLSDSESSIGETKLGKETWFHVFRSQKGGEAGAVLQFDTIMSRPILSKSTVFVPGIAWNLASQFNEGATKPCVVREANKDVTMKLPLTGTMHPDWKLEIQYKTGAAVKIGLYQKGVLLEEAFVTHCD